MTAGNSGRRAAMWKCESCGAEFDEPVTRREDHGYDTEIGHIPYWEYEDLCPECGDDDIKEVDE